MGELACFKGGFPSEGPTPSRPFHGHFQTLRQARCRSPRSPFRLEVYEGEVYGHTSCLSPLLRRGPLLIGPQRPEREIVVLLGVLQPRTAACAIDQLFHARERHVV